MEPISAGQIAAAIKHIDSLDITGRSALTEEIRANQPHAMLNIIELSRKEAGTSEISHAFHILRVIYTTLTAAAKKKLPRVTPKNIAKVRRDHLALALSMARGNLTAEVYLDYYPEPILLLWACDYLNVHAPQIMSQGNDLLLQRIQEVIDAFLAVRVTAKARRKNSAGRKA